MALEIKPPIQEITTDPNNGRFPQVWIRWLQYLSNSVITEIEADFFSNTVIVKQASDLINIDSTKNYMIDGVINLGTQSIEVPEGGLSLSALNGARDTSVLYSEEDNYTMFTSPSGGYSGDVVIESCTLDVTGASSKIFDLDNDGNSNAIDITGVNFGRSPVNRLTSLGELTDYRQLLLNGIGVLFCDDGLTFNGTWTGLAALTSIVVGFKDSATLFKEGTSLTFSGSVRSDMNFLSVGANSVFMDFDEANILEDSGLILDTFRSGASDAMPNLPGSNVKVRYSSCVGVRNTYVGGEYEVSTSATTTISATNTLVKMAGTTTYDDLQWFSQTTDNAFVYDSSQEVEMEVKGSLSFTNSANKTMGLQVRQWVDSSSAYVDIGPRFIATIGAGGRAENLSFIARCVINGGDRIEIWIENRSDTSNITAEVGGIVAIEERAN